MRFVIKLYAAHFWFSSLTKKISIKFFILIVSFILFILIVSFILFILIVSFILFILIVRRLYLNSFLWNFIITNNIPVLVSYYVTMLWNRGALLCGNNIIPMWFGTNIWFFTNITFDCDSSIFNCCYRCNLIIILKFINILS